MKREKIIREICGVVGGGLAISAMGTLTGMPNGIGEIVYTLTVLLVGGILGRRI